MHLIDKLYRFWFYSHSKVVAILAVTTLLFTAWGAFAISVLKRSSAHVYLELELTIPVVIMTAVLVWAQLDARHRIASAPKSDTMHSYRRKITWEAIIAGVTFALFVPISEEWRRQEDENEYLGSELTGTVSDLLGVRISPSSDLAQDLSIVRDYLSAANPERARIDISLEQLIQLSKQLATILNKHSKLPQAWQATAAFINFKSAILLTTSIPTELPSKQGVGDCHMAATQSGLYITGCTFDLARSGYSTNTVDGRPMPVYVTNCIVEYDGSPIPNPGVYHFRNCRMRFSLATIPHRKSLQIMTQFATNITPDFTVNSQA